MREYKLLIKGKWEVSKSRQEIKSPYDQNVVGKVYFAEKDKTEKAISAAHEAFSETKNSQVWNVLMSWRKYLQELKKERKNWQSR